MGRANIMVSAELREWLLSEQAWCAGVFILDDRTYGGDTHYLDVITDKLDPGYHGLCHLVVEGGDIRFRTTVGAR